MIATRPPERPGDKNPVFHVYANEIRKSRSPLTVLGCAYGSHQLTLEEYERLRMIAMHNLRD